MQKEDNANAKSNTVTCFNGLNNLNLLHIWV